MVNGVMILESLTHIGVEVEVAIANRRVNVKTALEIILI